MKGNFISYLIVGVILLIAFGFGVKYWDDIRGIFGKGKGFKECKDLSAFECIKKQGAIRTDSQLAGDRFDYPPDPNEKYGFYSNNRVIRFSDKRMGTYTKEEVKWDDGTTTLLIDIFK